MDFHQRSFTGEPDKVEMISLARLSLADHLHVIDLPYRLSSWALDDPANISLWVDAQGQLVGWVVLQTPFWTIDYICPPQVEQSLFPEMLAWANERARQALDTPHGRPVWFVNVFASQTHRIQTLEAAGYTDQSDVGEDSWSKVFMQRPAEMPVKSYTLPKGFVMRPLAGECEVQAYVELHQATFETKNMTVGWRQRTLRHPDYPPELDIVIAAPDSRLAAFCVGWLSKAPGGALIGQVEPLGCHKDFRQYALGRTVLCEVLRRLQSSGTESIYVETDNYRNIAFRLYGLVGFQVIRDVLVFRKDYAPT